MVTRYPDVIQVGDTKAEESKIDFSPRSWRAFLRGLESGTFGPTR